MEFWLGLLAVVLMLWICLKYPGAVLKGLLWFLILLPAGFVLWVFGLLLCCTILLIPLGIKLARRGKRMMFPSSFWG